MVMALEKPITGQATTPMVKAVLYVRCSTTQQETDNQRIALEQWAASRGFTIVSIYAENETAWKAGHQRELARLFNDLHRQKIDVCLVWSLDRLTREGVSAIFRILDRFRKLGVKVISLQEPWTEAPGEMTDLLYAVTGWVARFESRLRSERTKAGLARAFKEGKQPGRPKGAKDKRKRRVTGYLLRHASPELREKYG